MAPVLMLKYVARQSAIGVGIKGWNIIRLFRMSYALIVPLLFARSAEKPLSFDKEVNIKWVKLKENGENQNKRRSQNGNRT